MPTTAFLPVSGQLVDGDSVTILEHSLALQRPQHPKVHSWEGPELPIHRQHEGAQLGKAHS